MFVPMLMVVTEYLSMRVALVLNILRVPCRKCIRWYKLLKWIGWYWITRRMWWWSRGLIRREAHQLKPLNSSEIGSYDDNLIKNVRPPTRKPFYNQSGVVALIGSKNSWWYCAHWGEMIFVRLTSKCCSRIWGNNFFKYKTVKHDY